MEPEKETSSPARSSLWLLAPLGVLAIWAWWSKSITPPDERIESRDSQDNPAEKSYGIQTEAPLIPQLVPTPPTYSKTECRPDQTPWWKTLFELAAILIAFGLLVVNYHQQQSTQVAADAASCAAKTAAQQLRAFEDTQSAQLVVDKFEAKLAPLPPIKVLGLTIPPRPHTLRIRLNITVRNAGPTVAKEIFIEKNGGDFDLRSTPVQYPPWQWDTPLPLVGGRSLAPDKTFDYSPELPIVESEGTSTGVRRIYFTVGISWRDVFGHPHIVTECDFYSPITPPPWRGCFWTPTPVKH